MDQLVDGGDVSGEVAGEEASSRDLMFGWRREFVAHWADRISMRACIVIRANASLTCVLFLSKTLLLELLSVSIFGATYVRVWLADAAACGPDRRRVAD